MRPPEISDQDIIQAGQQVLAAGRTVNGFALRTLTGGGNPGRLMKVWEAHLSGQASFAESLPAAELPLQMAEELAEVTKVLSERLTGLVVSLNNQAGQAAERRVHQAQRAANEQGAKDGAALADASVLVDALQARLGQAQTDAEALQAQLAEAQALTGARISELALASERLGALERQSQQAGVEHAAELARLNQLLENECQSHQDAVELQRIELLEQADKAAHAHGGLSKELASAKADAQAARQAQNQQQASDKERFEAAEAERAKANEAAIEARGAAARLDGQVVALNAHVHALVRVIGSRLAAQDAKDIFVAPTPQTEMADMNSGSGRLFLQP